MGENIMQWQTIGNYVRAITPNRDNTLPEPEPEPDESALPDMEMRPVRKRFLIVHNAIAGMRRRWLLRHVCHELKVLGAELTLVSADSCEVDRQLAEEAVASGKYDAVIAAGGDSTVRGVTSGLRGSHVPLGIIPIGTGNVLAEEIRIRSGPKKLARNLMYGPAVSVLGGEANGTFFVAMAGAGFDAHVLARLNVKWKRRLGKLAYTIPVLKELTYKPALFSVEVDGEAHQCNWLIVTKVSRYGGPFHLVAGQKLWHDGFHAVLINTRNRRALAGIIFALARGKIESHPNVTVLPCRRVFVPRQPGVPTQLDGEIFETISMDIQPSSTPVDIIFPLPSERTD
jgi:diacylglycerol kinase (ATP)